MVLKTGFPIKHFGKDTFRKQNFFILPCERQIMNVMSFVRT
jgi:hypothetical protein